MNYYKDSILNKKRPSLRSKGRFYPKNLLNLICNQAWSAAAVD